MCVCVCVCVCVCSLQAPDISLPLLPFLICFMALMPEIHNQGVSRASLPSKPLEKEASSSGPRWYLACGSVTLISASIFTWQSFTCVSKFFFSNKTPGDANAIIPRLQFHQQGLYCLNFILSCCVKCLQLPVDFFLRSFVSKSSCFHSHKCGNIGHLPNTHRAYYLED